MLLCIVEKLIPFLQNVIPAKAGIQHYPFLQNVIPAKAGIQAKEKCHSREACACEACTCEGR